MRLRRIAENSHFARTFRHTAVAAVVVAMLLSGGCVRRRLAVRSNPPGAVVFVDNQQIGTTPCSVDFTYYGTREIRLEKAGFETLTVNQPIPMTWYQIPPIDFVSENLVPKKIVDHRTVSFDLQPQVIVPTEQLLERANQLRQETLQGTAAVAPPPSGPMTLPPATSPPAFAPSSVPPGTVAPTPTPAPFAPPTLPASPPSGSYSPQQGPPITSPPLR